VDTFPLPSVTVVVIVSTTLPVIGSVVVSVVVSEIVPDSYVPTIVFWAVTPLYTHWIVISDLSAVELRFNFPILEIVAYVEPETILQVPPET